MKRSARAGPRRRRADPVASAAAAREPERLGTVPYIAHRVVRHVRWARTEGIRRLVEEDRLNPLDRMTTEWAKARWRHRHGVTPGTARPVYVVGLQRSGTNMLTRGLDQAPEVEARNENDRTLFHRFRLREDDVVVGAVRRSRHEVVLVKPLCESHRVGDLLDLPELPRGRALWAFRNADDRARSEVSKFGDSNLRALQAIAAGPATEWWQAQRLPEESVELVCSLDPSTMSPDTAAVLFWVVRNQLYFDLGLDRRADTMLVDYDQLVADPSATMGRVCDFIGLPWRPSLYAHIQPRDAHGSRRLAVDPRVRELADALAARLAAGVADEGRGA